MSDLFLFIAFLLAFAILVYMIIALVKRKEYENSRIHSGYNVLVFGVIFLALSTLLKTVKFGLLYFQFPFIEDSLIYFDVATQLFIIPLFAISFFVAMLLFKDI